MQFPLIDFVAYKPDGKVVLLAEAKSRRGTSEAWAAKLRRNMMSHGALPKSDYFLIATPDRIYGWRQENLPPSEVPPQFLIDGTKALQPYFRGMNRSPDEITPRAFELVVFRWLTDISRPTGTQSEKDPSLNPLIESGLVSSLNDAQIELNSGR